MWETGDDPQLAGIDRSPDGCEHRRGGQGAGGPVLAENPIRPKMGLVGRA